MRPIAKACPDLAGGNSPGLDQLPEERRRRVYVAGSGFSDGESLERVRQHLQHPRSRLPHRRQCGQVKIASCILIVVKITSCGLIVFKIASCVLILVKISSCFFIVVKIASCILIVVQITSCIFIVIEIASCVFIVVKIATAFLL